MRASENSVRPSEALPLPGRRAWKKLCGILAAALLAAASGGCGSEKPVHYFQLTHPPTTSISSGQAPIDAGILVRLFQTSHLYREDRIVYGDDKVEMGLYENQRWTEPPMDLLQDAIARALRASGQFRMVTTLRSDSGVDYYLTGQLYAFREVTTNGMGARLVYEVELIDVHRGKVVWRYNYNHDEPSAGKSLGELALAMDKNVHQSVQELQDGLVRALSEYVRK